jgi:hypothetical protein
MNTKLNTQIITETNTNNTQQTQKIHRIKYKFFENIMLDHEIFMLSFCYYDSCNTMPLRCLYAINSLSNHALQYRFFDSNLFSAPLSQTIDSVQFVSQFTRSFHNTNTLPEVHARCLPGRFGYYFAFVFLTDVETLCPAVFLRLLAV